MAHEKNTRKKGGVGKILLVLVVLLALAVGGALLFAHNEISGNGRPGTEVDCGCKGRPFNDNQQTYEGKIIRIS